MKNNGLAAAVLAAPSAETSRLCRGIQFDDEGFSPEERKLEATRQIIWEKLVARLRTEFSRPEKFGANMVRDSAPVDY